MTQTTHIIYLSGFGNNYNALRGKYVARWRRRDITTEFVPMNWTDGASLEEKTALADTAISAALEKGKRVVLVGESAGGAMSLYLYARRPKDISHVITLCGKNRSPTTVSPIFYNRSPAFYELMHAVEADVAALRRAKRERIISIRPLFDGVVPIHEMLVADCQSVRVPSVGHITSIALILMFGGALIRKYATRS